MIVKRKYVRPNILSIIIDSEFSISFAEKSITNNNTEEKIEVKDNLQTVN
jgi:hypothetical protein